MKAYNILETGELTGFMEFVDKSEELARLLRDEGYVVGAFQKESILNYVEGLWSKEYPNIV